MTSTLLPRTWAGVAGDLHGDPDGGRRGFVLLHGLTFDRRMWDTVIDALPKDHPVLALDLPGHGDSPPLAAHGLEVVADAIHGAVEAAGLDAPVVVGHSLGAGVAGYYATSHPAAAMVNVDSPLRIEPTARIVRSLAPQLRNGGFGDVWPLFAESMHRELLPDGARVLLRAGDEVSDELVLSYWAHLLDQDVEEVMASLEARLMTVRVRRLPYLGVHGTPLDPAELGWVDKRIPQAEHVVLPAGHHFPHLAHPERFAALLTGLVAGLPAQER